MSNVQVLTIAIALATSFLAVLTGVLMNNSRLNDVKELLGAKIDRSQSQLHNEIERSQSQLQLLIEKNHSEMLLKFGEIDSRLTRIENERRIVQ